MLNPFARLIEPRMPSAAVGLSAVGASVVSLDRRRDTFAIKRAGYVALPEGLVRPSFDTANVADIGELGEVLAELVMSVGMVKQHRWSIALPEASTRTSIVTIESAPASSAELEEMLRWKIERAMAAPLDELRATRERLSPDAQGRLRYLVTAMRVAVLTEYESVFESLGWRAGLIVPRFVGEAAWLMRDGGSHSRAGDSLLVSGHPEGFTAVLLRGRQPLIVRHVMCETMDRGDELYRFLLFYRDRMAAPTVDDGGPPPETIERLLVVGEGIDEHDASALVTETLAATPRSLGAEDVRLVIPPGGLDFNAIAAPAGLATLAWG
ncbi:MAG: hypothetical protein M3458_15805 [Acidobacteriota bacterium]|nr:hypothetical protein [Acidobacteriota bacterium]